MMCNSSVNSFGLGDDRDVIAWVKKVVSIFLAKSRFISSAVSPPYIETNFSIV